jgi:hypothetical protein
MTTYYVSNEKDQEAIWDEDLQLIYTFSNNELIVQTFQGEAIRLGVGATAKKFFYVILGEKKRLDIIDVNDPVQNMSSYLKRDKV